MTCARYPVHKLIQDLMRDPARAAQFAGEPETFFEDYGLTADERALLREGSASALHNLGVHPNLQMKYRRIRAAAGPPVGVSGPLKAYLGRLSQT